MFRRRTGSRGIRHHNVSYRRVRHSSLSRHRPVQSVGEKGVQPYQRFVREYKTALGDRLCIRHVSAAATGATVLLAHASKNRHRRFHRLHPACWPTPHWYVACALARDACIWSDDSDFEEQHLLSVFTTSYVVETLDTT